MKGWKRVTKAVAGVGGVAAVNKAWDVGSQLPENFAVAYVPHSVTQVFAGACAIASVQAAGQGGKFVARKTGRAWQSWRDRGFNPQHLRSGATEPQHLRKPQHLRDPFEDYSPQHLAQRRPQDKGRPPDR
jgi:hypothetical protein